MQEETPIAHAKRCTQFSFFGTFQPPNFVTFATGHILTHEAPVGPSQAQHLANLISSPGQLCRAKQQHSP